MNRKEEAAVLKSLKTIEKKAKELRKLFEEED